jgi:hypothetical protein
MFVPAKARCVTLALPHLGLRLENQTSFYIMPRPVVLRNSTFRRHRNANKLLATGAISMRPCAHYLRSSLLCILSPHSEKCEQCYRFNRPCDLASSWSEVNRLLEKRDKLRKKRLAAEAKAIRLRKQERQLLKRVRALGDREEQNLAELKMEKAAAEALKPSAEGQPQAALSPTGFSQVSFDSFGKTSPVPTGSS